MNTIPIFHKIPYSNVHMGCYVSQCTLEDSHASLSTEAIVSSWTPTRENQTLEFRATWIWYCESYTCHFVAIIPSFQKSMLLKSQTPRVASMLDRLCLRHAFVWWNMITNLSSRHRIAVLVAYTRGRADVATVEHSWGESVQVVLNDLILPKGRHCHRYSGTSHCICIFEKPRTVLHWTRSHHKSKQGWRYYTHNTTRHQGLNHNTFCMRAACYSMVLSTQLPINSTNEHSIWHPRENYSNIIYNFLFSFLIDTISMRKLNTMPSHKLHTFMRA